MESFADGGLAGVLLGRLLFLLQLSFLKEGWDGLGVGRGVLQGLLVRVNGLDGTVGDGV